jgi:hypothetical protein
MVVLRDLHSRIQGRVPFSIRPSRNQSASYRLSASNQSALAGHSLGQQRQYNRSPDLL